MRRAEDLFGLDEPERYELHEDAPWLRGLDRREFLALAGGGLLIVLCGEAAPAQERDGRRRGGGRGSGRLEPPDVSAWIHVGEDGVVTVFCGKVEVGQGSRTSLSQVVADELSVAPAMVKMVLADTDLVPFDGGTAGSQTSPSMAPRLRKAAAAAREALIDLAAAELAADRAALVAAEGVVSHPPSSRKASYGQLTKGRKLVRAVEESPQILPADRWRIAGQPLARVGGREIVTGAHLYPSDIRLEGMLHGRVLRPPAYGATLVSLDDAKAKEIPGVTVVRDGSFAGVVAPDPQVAARALAALKAEWKDGPPRPSSKELFEHLKKGGGSGGGRGGAPEERGSVETGLASAHKKLEAVYTVAYIAHAPLEPRAAVAEWKDGKLTVWTGTQRPFGVRGDLAQTFGVTADKVRVIVPDTGAGYGGKHTGDAAVEAARLARAAGKPVKLVWTREEEFTWAYFRPAGVIEVRSGASKEGDLVAWEHHNYNSGGSAIRAPYRVPNQKTQFHNADSPLRQGSYRALASTANCFARESHLDELARALGLDPVAFRLRNLEDQRLRAVLEAAVERFGWARWQAAAGRGRGVACGTEKGSYVATCAEVSVDKAAGKVKVERLVTAFECGAILNPENLRNQVEGAAVMGLGGALHEAIDFAEGRVLNPRFSAYRVPRFSDVPVLETVLLDRKDLPSAGAGETPIIGIAPAVANAIFDASGTRLRSLPLVPDGLKA